MIRPPISESNPCIILYYLRQYLLGYLFGGCNTAGSWAEHCKNSVPFIPRGFLLIVSFLFFFYQILGENMFWVTYDKIKGHDDQFFFFGFQSLPLVSLDTHSDEYIVLTRTTDC